MKRDQDKNRKFFFDFIKNEWDQIQSGNCNNVDVENSFIGQLLKVSANGRNYSIEDILDHCGTMMVAVSIDYSILRLVIRGTPDFITAKGP
jgi:hypothetical protein